MLCHVQHSFFVCTLYKIDDNWLEKINCTDSDELFVSPDNPLVTTEFLYQVCNNNGPKNMRWILFLDRH